jgi:glucose/arabinose dehydrogenase
MVGRTQGGFLLMGLVILGACDDPSALEISETEQRAPSSVVCAADNGGITLPAGFCATVFADLTIDGAPARARHLVVLPGGDVFVAINSPRNQQPSFGVIGLRDTNQDGRADTEHRFSPGLGGSGLAWRSSVLYFGANDRVIRWRVTPGSLVPVVGSEEVVVSGLIATGDHISKTVVVPDASTLYVNIGSASNACQVENRQLHSPGVNPCPELPTRAGVWRFDARGTNQTPTSGERYGTGLRNMVALAVNPADNELYGVQHGRDMLFENWPENFTVEEDAVLPSEELVRITRGSDNGWPYCYFDAVTENKKVLAPEYGGNGQLVSGGGFNCASFNQPLVNFGAHWAPNGMVFYTGRQFPAKYRGGLFVAFHGGFDRAPLPNEGYQVAFVPFNGSTANTNWETFADGFAGPTPPFPANAIYRPVGVAEGPDGSLYVSDDKGGRIWRIIYRGP